jgi:hypothetical protein
MLEAGIRFVGFGLSILIALPDSNLSHPSTDLNWFLTASLPLVHWERWSVFLELPGGTVSAAEVTKDKEESAEAIPLHHHCGNPHPPVHH